ncbi:Structural maintenance of chromosomes protein 2 [Chytriomyces hyalinus]|nr:Structural maintenance of chromosomes protein 2 [Chytriomyces hyalinus]
MPPISETYPTLQHIEEIVLDGFKSYATRTVIGGWDRQFNAITGLNGSGKSNILDAICFVLGIATLSHVRATNLTDLVYKRGQAGITKATVSIVFNNTDKKNCPLGYADDDKITVARQLIVGGKNTYLINGVKKTQADVASLFHSVQLNINNPHFIIMQGKITKVLNMKPAEVLAMVEEAAGTRMFEDRREKAVKVIGKKDTKMDEIQSLLQTEIQPKLSSLRDKKRDFMEFQKLENEISQIGNFLTAHEFWICEKKIKEFDAEYDEMKSNLATQEAEEQSFKHEMIHIENMIQSLAANKHTTDGEFHRLEAEAKELNKDIAKMKSQIDIKSTTLIEENANLTALKQSRQENTATLATLSEAALNEKNAFDAKKGEHEARVKGLEKKKDLLQTLTTGVSAVQGHENGYLDQLHEAQTSLSNCDSVAQQARLKIKHFQQELSSKEPKAKKAHELNKSLVDSLAEKRVRADALKAKVDKIVVPALDEAYEQRDVQLEKVAKLKKTVQRIEKDISAYLFSYSNPSRSFDPSDVKGLIAELIRIPEKNLESVTALETCAGGRLFNVIVSNEVVGSHLVDKSKTKLSKRVTFIPLNKIVANQIDTSRIRSAKEIAPGKVELAIDLVDFEQDLVNAMKYVFGSTLICKDTASAKSVTFDKNVRLRSVTLDGDVYEPSGSLSGGSRGNSANILTQFQNYTQMRGQLNEQEKVLEKILDGIKAGEAVRDERDQAHAQYDLALHECGLLEQQIASNGNSQVIFQVEKLKADIGEETKRIEESEKSAAELKKLCKTLENDMKRFSTNREETLSSLKKEIQAEKGKLASEAKLIQADELAVRTVLQEKIDLEQELKEMDSTEATLKDLISSLKVEIEELSLKHEEALQTFKQVDDKLSIERQAIMSHDSEVQAYEKSLKACRKRIADQEVVVAQLRVRLEKGAAEYNMAETLLQQIVSDPANEWIQDVKTQFGAADGRFNFAKQDIPELKKRVHQLEELRKKSSRNLDRSAMDAFDRIEKKEAALIQKISTVIKDKSKIEETIDSLEKYKSDKLYKTWEKVSRDFGLIFGDLLPGNSAKLTPADGKDLSSGLEVQVCLGGVWKENLTELSGGQRSLVALSLILALLQFKPAPMYILDEVDSALDESHTQNIGQLLKTRFKEAQFILVSLKDGMYTNANVLFRTKFRDGVSTIERFSQNGTLNRGKKAN